MSAYNANVNVSEKLCFHPLAPVGKQGKHASNILNPMTAVAFFEPKALREKTKNLYFFVYKSSLVGKI